MIADICRVTIDGKLCGLREDDGTHQQEAPCHNHRPLSWCHPFSEYPESYNVADEMTRDEWMEAYS